MRTSTAYRSRCCLRSALAAGIILALSGPAIAQAQQTTAPVAAAPVADFDISSQSLDTALTRLADQGSVRILFVSEEVAGVEAKGIAGRYTAGQALTQLLDGTGLAWRWREPGIVVVESATGRQTTGQGAVVTDSLSVGGMRRDEATGAQRDIQGYDDVYDLDISTSYVGRKEIERYKGATPSDLLNGVAGVFSGDARNSGALDVNIRGIQGPGRVPVTIDGTEQALTVWRGYNGVSNRNYIDPNLIGGMQIFKGPSLTRNVNSGIGGAVVIETLDVDDIVPEGERFGGEFKVEGSSNAVEPRPPARLYTGQDYRNVPELATTTPANDPTLRVQPHTGGGGNNVFDGEDYAYRLALGWKSDAVDLLAAYAYRDRGNYYAGERNTGYYSQPPEDASVGDYITTMASRLRPGEEVTNTSSKMESWLFKATWRPSDDQELQLGYRDSLSHSGEIMPSRINRTEEGVPQWPLSRVDARSWNLEYKWRPEDSRWIDLYLNAWRSETDSATYTAGSYPNYWDRTHPVITNGGLADTDNARNGLTLSNKFRLADTLDLTVGGDFQHEKLRSRDEYLGPTASWRMFPRAGRREEWNANFNFEWRPVDFLTLTAGARYSSFWAYDDFVAAHPDEIRSSISGYSARYFTRSPEELTEFEASQRAGMEFFQDLFGYTDEQVDALVDDALANWNGIEHTVPWTPDVSGNYRREDNACLNGSVAGNPYVNSTVMFEGPCRMSLATDLVWSGYATARKHRDHGWTPSFSATAQLSDYSRAYFSYNELLRYPSMFESTLAFSASINPFTELKPEHVYNYELAYIHDLGHLLANDAIADIKLTWYSRKTDDLIERDNSFYFHNIDKQTVRGLEFQGRYDNGRFFTDLAVAHVLKNEVCDENTALLLDPTFGRVPTCVDQGFIGSYLLTQAIPELSANWSLGGRFLDRRLEIGGRVTYYEKRKTNRDLEDFAAVTDQNLGVFNVPFSWDDTLLLDAYASYRINDALQAELVGTNLTNQYYADPATRSLLPAPGRTLKLSLTARF
jgi:hemoglobin/transferrin/lactoferrin receptor protein